MSWLKSAITAGGGLLGSIWDNYQANKRAEEDRAYQSQLSEWEWQRNLEATQSQREWDLAMWNRQNEYNDPASQMERYRAAGLNPNLALQSGALSPGMASSAPSSSVPRFQARESKINKSFLDFSKIFNVMREITNYDLDTQQREVEIDKKVAEVNKINSEILTNEKQRHWLETQANVALTKSGIDMAAFDSDRSRREYEAGYWNARKGLAYIEAQWDRENKKIENLSMKDQFKYNKAKMEFDKDIMSMSLPYYRTFYDSKRQLFEKFGTDGVDYRYSGVGTASEVNRIGLPLISQLGDTAIQTLGNIIETFARPNKKTSSPGAHRTNLSNGKTLIY